MSNIESLKSDRFGIFDIRKANDIICIQIDCQQIVQQILRTKLITKNKGPR